jgi:hypothetical protein
MSLPLADIPCTACPISRIKRISGRHHLQGLLPSGRVSSSFSLAHGPLQLLSFVRALSLRSAPNDICYYKRQHRASALRSRQVALANDVMVRRLHATLTAAANADRPIFPSYCSHPESVRAQYNRWQWLPKSYTAPLAAFRIRRDFRSPTVGWSLTFCRCDFSHSM